MAEKLSQDAVLLIGRAGTAVRPVVDTAGRYLMRSRPRSLPMRVITINDATETALTPNTLQLIKLSAQSDDSVAVGVTLTGGGGGTVRVLALVHSSADVVGAIVVEALTGSISDAETVTDGVTFTAVAKNVSNNLRPCLSMVKIHNLDAAVNAEMTIRPAPGIAYDSVVLLAVAAGGRDQLDHEYTGRAAQPFTIQSALAATPVTVSVAWFVEIPS